MREHTHVRRWAVAATAAVAALLGATVAAPALAAPTIDPAQTGSITVHKYEQPLLRGDAGDGLELPAADTAGWDALADIRFTAARVPGIDLGTDAGWSAAAAMTVADAAAAVAGATPDADGITASDGVVVFDDLDLGAYYVQEHLTAAQLASGLTPGAPFVVTVPITHPADLDAWLYGVHVYPKNNNDAIVKRVEDSDTIGTTAPDNGNNNAVVWTIDASIPEGGQTDRWLVVDDLDPRLEFVAAETAVTIDGLTAPALDLIAADYTVTATRQTTLIGSAATVDEHTRVTIELTATGLAKIEEAKKANPAAQVRISITTLSTAIGDGVIPNDAVLFPNQYQVDHNPSGIPSNKVETRLGSIRIAKTAMDGTTALAGAQFAVFLDEAAARAGDLTQAVDIPGQPAGTKVVTTDARGEAAIGGLRLSNFVDGARIADTDPEYRTYYLVEVVAPEGYGLLADPIEVELVDAGAVTGPFTYQAAVRNAPHNAGFELPLTGGTGTVVFWGTGAGLLLLAAGIAIRARRSRAVA
ncbi:SpaH/EbpB family LPXTG-anchored major pilin [Microbacterium sp. zg.Y909]|uniref:SpaH/EbpB family LPXTG-anchored major pilin n=1 Tax=Microbacterium sp. zg.Y909 TaxID=2969413 RepID=UPI00214AE067|nr:SpaH/EbpB family LPXTG-anchored major pilin [Microbacterium sp. zg.Y909]MCR2825692.1 SpaH/EbpB family LPXTG-anchored major pilin [Microbacterium sp. zg.Y909]